MKEAAAVLLHKAKQSRILYKCLQTGSNRKDSKPLMLEKSGLGKDINQAAKRISIQGSHSLCNIPSDLNFHQVWGFVFKKCSVKTVASWKTLGITLRDSKHVCSLRGTRQKHSEPIGCCELATFLLAADEHVDSSNGVNLIQPVEKAFLAHYVSSQSTTGKSFAR